MIVPFPARGRGFSREDRRIISLKILLKAGATLFASSTIGLFKNVNMRGMSEKKQPEPKSIPNRDDVFFIIWVDRIWCFEFNKDAGLIALSTEHDTTHDATQPINIKPKSEMEGSVLRTAHENVFHRSRDSFFARCMNDDIVLSSNTKEKK